MISFGNTPQRQADALAERFKIIRKQQGFTQAQLADRSGVSLSSLKRFEQQGEIALLSLLKLAHVLNCLDDFEKLFQKKEKEGGKNLDQLFSEDW
ncbi:helix-turn-helix transcriptional regulator [Persicobacter diffluens]|uniref:HTH cro/C1-type domain-containing protein n=1 Tax=Persicobacter diffluens TaxID=981 RepID=A0AAN4W3F4_9BACT|nr:hypothetical protein PEDI_55610 [Persicobacter diffluens]